MLILADDLRNVRSVMVTRVSLALLFDFPSDDGKPICVGAACSIDFSQLSVEEILWEFFIAIVIDVDVIDIRILRREEVHIGGAALPQVSALKIIQQVLFDDPSGSANDTIHDMLANARERFILIIRSIPIDEDVIVIQRDRDRVQLYELHGIGPAFSDIDGIFNGRIGSGVHDKCILTQAVVHVLVI
jgi:hypothetical protein